MEVNVAAEQMLKFIKGYPGAKAVRWPTDAEIKEWEAAVEWDKVLTGLIEEEFSWEFWQ